MQFMVSGFIFAPNSNAQEEKNIWTSLESNPMSLVRQAWLAIALSITLWFAVAVVVQLVKCPELRSLKEVQLSQREFDSQYRS